jgi:tripartite-type tricarboxylate transporter receptor subunit TctC
MRICPAVAAFAAVCVLQMGGATQAHAQDAAANYPSSPIKIVVPYPPGSIPDTLGRMIGDRLQTQFGKPVVIENRAGASTLLGAKAVAGAEPDGYTLLIPTVTTLSIAPQLNPKAGVDPINDLTPIARLGGTNFFLVVRSSFPAKTMREWIDEVKANPGKYRYASAGAGTPHHIFMELLKKQFSLDITHIPYKGSAPAIQDVMAGQVDMMFDTTVVAGPHIESGKLRALAVSSAKRVPSLPNVPTVAESGVPGYEVVSWQAIYAPAGTPKAIVERLHGEIAKILATAEMQERLAKLGMQGADMTPQQLGAFQKAEVEKWAAVIKSANIKLE